MRFKNLSHESGQILLIVVLAAVVSLTVGLSAVSRTITNTRVTTEEANSQKALSAAEAGIEELVATADGSRIPSLNKSLSNNSSYNASANQVDDPEFLLNGGNTVLKDDGGDVWLSTHPDFGDPKWSGNMRVFWKDNDGCTVSGSQVVNAAIEIIVISGVDRANPSMNRFAYDPCGSRASANGFSTSIGGAGSVQGVPFQRSVVIGITNGFIARIIPIYANTTIGIQSSNSLNPFPSQGYVIESTGTSGTTKRAVRVFQGWPRVPIEYFPYNLFLP